MEFGPDGPIALWAVNDQRRPLVECLVEWRVSAVSDGDGRDAAVVTRGSAQVDLPAQRAIRVSMLHWRPEPEKRYRVVLRLLHQGALVDENVYEDPFHPLPRPQNYPWHFDRLLGMRCFGGRHAQSSLKVLNTWYGRIARWFFPVHEWAESMLRHKAQPPMAAWLKRLFG